MTSQRAQSTDFTRDVLGRYVCNGFDEAVNSTRGGEAEVTSSVPTPNSTDRAGAAALSASIGALSRRRRISSSPWIG
jgi:hypothetical protein